jgi:hypothetical protein
VLFYVLFLCKCVLPPGDDPIAVNKYIISTWSLGEPSQHSLLDTGKPRKTCAEVAGRRTFRILTSGQHLATKAIYTYVEMLVRKPEGERDHLEDLGIDGRLILFSETWLLYVLDETFLSG